MSESLATRFEYDWKNVNLSAFDAWLASFKEIETRLSALESGKDGPIDDSAHENHVSGTLYGLRIGRNIAYQFLSRHGYLDDGLTKQFDEFISDFQKPESPLHAAPVKVQGGIDNGGLRKLRGFATCEETKRDWEKIADGVVVCKNKVVIMAMSVEQIESLVTELLHARSVINYTTPVLAPDEPASKGRAINARRIRRGD